MKPLLEIKNLTYRYPSFALENVSFSIPGGTIMGLVGENGAGKTTMIRTILGTIRPDAGEIRFQGRVLTEENKSLKNDIGVVFDNLSFYGNLNATQAARITANVYSNWDQAYFETLLQKFRLEPKKKLRAYSSGMKMRLSLILALSHHPKLLLLDEPTSGIDPVVRDEMMELFLDFIQDEEHAILFSTHITSDLEKVADYVTFLHNGKMMLSIAKDTLLYEYGIVRCSKAAFDAVVNKANVLSWMKKEYEWDILVSNRRTVQEQFPDIVVDVPTLEEILLMYVKGVQV